MAKLRPLLAEFIGTFALIFVGIGAIKTAGHDIVAVALAHGLTIAAFVSAALHISGGQLNPAVTFGLVLRRPYDVVFGVPLLDRATAWCNRRRFDLPRFVRARCRHYWNSAACD
jgi:glycerol uptake facilitator-like aquaporin